ncbi:MAG: protein kinase [Verrucomicrobia bacterium]|nr:protein kinase [Verrucomicrobiota bacterium]
MNDKPQVQCWKCGRQIPADAPRGVCPQCLLTACLREEYDPGEAADAASHHLSSALDHVGSHESIGGRLFGDYELIEVIGRGGMGTVYRARQRSLNRTVALKMLDPLRLAVATEAHRFRMEAEAAARLQHPNILPVYEVGEHSGQPYFTAKYLSGGCLAERSARTRLEVDLVDASPASNRTIQRRIAVLMGKVCRAVAHAHERGVLHRDLKPANILVDQDGEPCVADFGLAKLLDTDLALTQTLAPIGTPGYAAPEQCREGVKQLTVAADIYSLGAVLYDLLTGRPPFRGSTPIETQRKVLDEEVKPPHALCPCVDRDLETICLRCLQKDPKRRFASVAELAEEFERFAAGLPIRARPVNVGERLLRWCRRKPALAALGFVSSVLLLLVIIGSPIALTLVREQRDRAERSATGERRENYFNSVTLARHYIDQGSTDMALDILLRCPAELRHWEWGRLVYLCHQWIMDLEGHRTNVTALEFHPGGRWLASRDASGRLKVWEWSAGKILFAYDEPDPVTVCAFAPGGNMLALGTKGGSVWVHEVASWNRERRTTRTNVAVTALAWAPHGGRWAAGFGDGSAAIGPMNLGQVTDLPVARHQPIERISFSPDGGRVLLHRGAIVTVHDAVDGTIREHFPEESAGPERIWADATGRRWATIDGQNLVRLWSGPASARELTTLRGAQLGMLRWARFSADGNWLVHGGEQGTARVWSTDTAKEQLTLPTRVYQATFSPDGRLLATLGGFTSATIWDIGSGREYRVLKGHSSVIESFGFSADGRFLATGDRLGQIKVWSATNGREVMEEQAWVWGTQYSPNGRRLAMSPFRRGVMLWDADAGRKELTLKVPMEFVAAMAFSPDGRWLATAGSHHVARLWDLEKAERIRSFHGHRGVILWVAYAPNGQTLATACVDGTAKIWDVATGQELRTLAGHIGWVRCVAYHPDGRRVATVGQDAIGRMWDIDSGRLLVTFEGHRDQIDGVSFSHDGRTMVTTGRDETVRLWDSDSGAERSHWSTRGTAVVAHLDPSGGRLALGSTKWFVYGGDAATVAVYEPQTGRRVLDLEGALEPIGNAVWSSTGRRLAADGTDLTLRQWEAFPWEESEYRVEPQASLKERIRHYARGYWSERVEAEWPSAEHAGVEPRVVVCPLEPELFPSRVPELSTDLLDLSRHYTAPLHVAFHPVFLAADECDSLAGLPRGVVTLDGVAFDVRGVIQMRRFESRGGPFAAVWEETPVRVGEIPVERSVRRLHLLHGCVGEEAEGVVVARLLLQFADGSEVEWPLVYGVDLKDWWEQPGETSQVKRGRVVWRGNNPRAEQAGATLRLYHSNWENPRPDLEVKTLDCVSELTRSAPFIIAITVE